MAALFSLNQMQIKAEKNIIGPMIKPAKIDPPEADDSYTFKVLTRPLDTKCL
jgi:hypothetical protein